MLLIEKVKWLIPLYQLGSSWFHITKESTVRDLHIQEVDFLIK